MPAVEPVEPPPVTAARLRPGLRAVPRGRDRWQLGIVDAVARVLPRAEATDRLVSALAGPGPAPDDPASRRLLAELDAAGLVDSDEREADRLRRRTGTRVLVRGSLLPDGGADAAALLQAAGARVVRRPPADLVVRLHVGELDRSETDDWIRAGLPHLLVRALDGVVVLGPFVLPGQTACLGCLDAHRAEDDPEHPAVVDRYARATARPRADGLAEPVDPTLATLATAWAARDALSFAEGRRPSTWSSTVTMCPALAEVTAVSWLRHPTCGCVWPEPSGTMEG